MIKHIYIATINRHGGSLLARLFDSHEDVASYPLETGFKKDFETFNKCSFGNYFLKYYKVIVFNCFSNFANVDIYWNTEMLLNTN